MAGDPYAAPPPERPFAAEAGRAPGRLRIGFMERSPAWAKAPLHADCLAAVRDAAKLLESLGHSLEPKHPAAVDDPGVEKTLFTIIIAQTAGLLTMVEGMLGRPIRADEVELWTWTLFQEGKRCAMLDFLAAVEWRNVISRSFGEFYGSGFDLLLTPTLGQPPLPLGALTPKSDALQNSGSEIAGSPVRFWIGVQLVAPWGREDLLLRVAGQLEAARPWVDRRPRVHA